MRRAGAVAADGVNTAGDFARAAMLGAALLLGGCGGMERGDGPIRFASLAPGERIEVRVSSKGCFHDERMRLRFHADEGGTGLRARGSTREAWRFWARPERYAVEIAPSDVRRLDALLDRYRAGPGETLCTTTDDVTVTLFRGRTPVRREHFRDESCTGMLDPAILSFAALAWKARPSALHHRPSW